MADCKVDINSTALLSQYPSDGYLMFTGLPTMLSPSGMGRLPVGLLIPYVLGKLKFVVWQIQVDVTSDISGIILPSTATSFLIKQSSIVVSSVYLVDDAGTEIKQDVTNQQSYGVLYGDVSAQINLLQPLPSLSYVIVHYCYVSN